MLHYVNSRSAERASLSTIAQSNFNLKLNSSVMNLSDDGPTDVNENDKNVKSVEDIKLQEKTVFGFFWKHLAGFKVKD